MAWRGIYWIFCLLVFGFQVWSACPAGGNFLFWQKRKSPKKVAQIRDRVGAGRSDGPSLRPALGTWRCAQLAMAVAGWFCPSLANSFTLCLIGSFVRLFACSFVLAALPRDAA
jgi:hypothetical protein